VYQISDTVNNDKVGDNGLETNERPPKSKKKEGKQKAIEKKEILGEGGVTRLPPSSPPLFSSHLRLPLLYK
jgi:hypothetical protein